MRVGINAQKLFDSQDYRNAGVSRYIRGICAHLPAVPGPERFVLYTNWTMPTWPDVEGPRLRVAPSSLPTLAPIARIAWEQAALPMLGWRDRLDVLHCPLNVLPVATRVPVVLTIHDLTFIRFPDRFHQAKRRYLALLTRHAARRAARIVTDSAATRADVIAAFGVDPARVEVVYPGVDPDFRASHGEGEALEAFRARLGLPDRYILYLGTLEPRKNVDRLVRAFARLVRQGFPHRLVLAGGRGWDHGAIDGAVADEGVTDRVTFPGYVRREDQPFWYGAADLFVYPSQYEGFGLPVLEALACGTPVITSNVSSLPEVVGDAGITVDPADVGSLADAMAAVLSERALATRMREAGPSRAATFTWANAAGQCVRAYRQAAAAPARTFIG